VKPARLLEARPAVKAKNGPLLEFANMSNTNMSNANMSNTA
jgi:hypothetical protein